MLVETVRKHGVPSFEKARETILSHVTRLGAESAPVLDALGRVLAADVKAPWDMPRWDNSAMDGYAVRSLDCAGSGRLELSGYLPAGSHSAEVLAPGTAVKILTGAPLPPGADTIVPVEEAEERDGAIQVHGPLRPGAHVRHKGEDIKTDETILLAGTLVGPAEISALASFSWLSVPVVRKARVAILSTGDELVEPGQPLAPGKIHDSNSFALAAAVKQAGGEPILLGIARDDRAALEAQLRDGLEADALVTSAGVSVGDRDLVREVLQALSVQQVFWKVDIKPGRPTAFAVHGTKPVFSLPGNPVSALLTFEEFVRPALLKMMGHRRWLRPLVPALLQEDLPKKPGRVVFLRVRLERRGGALLAWPSGNQDTGILKTQLLADGIAVVPAEQGYLPSGMPVEVQILRDGFPNGEP